MSWRALFIDVLLGVVRFAEVHRLALVSAAFGVRSLIIFIAYRRIPAAFGAAPAFGRNR